ncbi:MAG: hypothetical protein ACUVUD_00730 [bacterium]
MRTFFVSISWVSAMMALNPPEPGLTPPKAVPFETVQTLAQRKAEAEWPGCRMGVVVPYVDEEGYTVGYMFHFRTDGEEFPDYEEVVQDVFAERERLTVNTDLTRWRSNYAHLFVSARYDRPPIVFYGYGASEFYAIAPEGLRRAEEILGYGVALSRIYFVSPLTFLEFSSPSGEVVVFSNHFERVWRSREAFLNEVRAQKRRVRTDEELTAAHHRQEWEEALKRDFSKFDVVYVPNAERAPFYDWSYGCTPTSAAMVLGYIDRTQDYGRLVDWYWQRWDMVEGEWDKQIPNVQRECALRMFTDTTRGGTYLGAIAQGLYLVGYDNGYDFEMVEDYGSAGNDWAWNTVVNEIDGGYAHVWSATWAIHSLAAYGYRTPDKDIYVHNTWWTPAEWWHYSGDGQSHVASPHPRGGDVHRFEVRYPMGDTFYNSIGRGETLQVGDTVDVIWDNFGHPGDWVAIDISFNAGRSWSFLDSVPDTGLYRWYLNPELTPCESVRLQFRQYVNGTLTSADGTFGCFRFIREPLPPTLLSPRAGSQILNPPVVLVVDTILRNVDSFCFRVYYGLGDTIWRETKTSPRCSLPDTIFTFNRSYKWICKAHNRFGWGEFSPPADFRIRFNPGVEENRDLNKGFELLPTVQTLRARRLDFALAPGVRVEIYDATGRNVQTLNSGRSGKLTWNLRDETGVLVPAGVYFLHLSQPDRPKMKLLLVE